MSVILCVYTILYFCFIIIFRVIFTCALADLAILFYFLCLLLDITLSQLLSVFIIRDLTFGGHFRQNLPQRNIIKQQIN